MTELWMLRHGQTDWNAEMRYQGQMDVPLNAKGIEQAYAAAESLSGRTYAAMYSSDLVRTRQTAEIIAERLGMFVHYDPCLREVFMGSWEGKLFSDIRQQFPAEVAWRQQDPLNARSPGGEMIAEVLSRSIPLANEIHKHYPGERVLVVTHGIVLTSLMLVSEGISIREIFRRMPDNAQPQVIHWNGEVGDYFASGSQTENVVPLPSEELTSI